MVTIVNTDGTRTPFAPERVVGSLVTGGISPAVALDRARELSRILDSSGLAEVSTDDVRYALDELSNKVHGPDYRKISQYIKAAHPIVPLHQPVIVQKLLDVRRESLSSFTFKLLGALTSLSQAAATRPKVTPISDLFGAFADLAQTAVQQLTGVEQLKTYRAVLATVGGQFRAGVDAAREPETLREWIPGAIGTLDRFIAVYGTLPNGGEIARPLMALKKTLADLTFTGVGNAVGGWQTPVLAALLALPKLWAVPNVLAWFGSTPSNCPPCPPTCPYLDQTLWVHTKYSNPKNCGTEFHVAAIVGVVFRTCTWDFEERYTLLSGCYDHYISWFDAPCCLSIYEWTRTGSRKWTQDGPTFGVEVGGIGVGFTPELPDEVEFSTVSGGDGNPAPTDATKVR